MKRKEKDYNILHAQLLELEQNWRQLQEDKNRADHEAKDVDTFHAKKNESFQADIRGMKNRLEEKQNLLNGLNSELLSYRKLVEEKGIDLSKLKTEIANCAADNTDLLREKKRIEGEYSGELERKKAADLEIDRLNQLNDRESLLQAEAEKKAKENEFEILQLKREADKISDEITALQAVEKERERDIGANYEGKMNNQKEIEKLLALNAALEDENKELALKSKDEEYELAQNNNRIEDTYALIDNKEKDLKIAKSGLASVDIQTMDTMEQIKKLQKDNDALQGLLDKYKNDANMHKRLRENEISEKLEIAEEKKKLERAVLKKEMEALSAKKELDKVQVSKDILLDDHYQLNKELGAIKEHADILESQNNNVIFLFV